MKRGFTLLELIVVIIIIGILATLGFAQYTKTIEKGRAAEAKVVLGQIRGAQEAYKLQNGVYATTISDLSVEAGACDTDHYFGYTTNNTTGTAARCTTGGKSPNASTGYNVTIIYSTSTWGGTSGYY